LAPTSGAAAGGTAVTVTGTNLSGTIAVLFDDVPGTGLVTSDTSVVVTTPAHGAGAVTVTVVTPGGVIKKTTAFTFS
jgi:hypothetical protein